MCLPALPRSTKGSSDVSSLLNIPALLQNCLQNSIRVKNSTFLLVYKILLIKTLVKFRMQRVYKIQATSIRRPTPPRIHLAAGDLVRSPAVKTKVGPRSCVL